MRIRPLDPRLEVVADALADVERDRRRVVDPRLGDRGEDLVEVLVVVREAREDGRDQDRRPDARLGEAAEDLEPAPPGRVPGSTTRRTSSSSVPTLMETVTSATSFRRWKTSRSRMIIVDFVSMESGFAKSASVSTTPLVSR